MKRPITLTTDEIRELTGKTRCAAQVRVLQKMGVPVKIRPDGSPCVARQAAEAALGVHHLPGERGKVTIRVDAI